MIVQEITALDALTHEQTMPRPTPPDRPSLPAQCPRCQGSINEEHRAYRECKDPRRWVIEFYCEFCAWAWVTRWALRGAQWHCEASAKQIGEDAEIHRMILEEVIGC